MRVSIAGAMARKFIKRNGEKEEDLIERITGKLQIVLDVFGSFPATGDELEIAEGEKYRIQKRDFYLVDNDSEMELTVEMIEDSTDIPNGNQ